MSMRSTPMVVLPSVDGLGAAPDIPIGLETGFDDNRYVDKMTGELGCEIDGLSGLAVKIGHVWPTGAAMPW